MNKFSGLVAFVLILWGVGYIVAHGDQGPDEGQIRATLERGRQAIQEKNLSKAMSCVSPNYKDSADYDFDKIRLLGVNIFRSDAAYSVTVEDVNLQIHGNQADGKARIAVRSNDVTVIPARELTLHFRKEPARRFIIYHTLQWKVSGMDGLPTVSD